MVGVREGSSVRLIQSFLVRLSSWFYIGQRRMHWLRAEALLAVVVVVLSCLGTTRTDEGQRWKRQDIEEVGRASRRQPCRSPKGEQGNCLSIRECQPLLELLKRASTDQQAADYLRRSRCGGYAEVCCVVEAEKTTTKRPTTESSTTAGVTSASNSVCGKSFVRQSNKVVGGQPADLGAWPWIAALGYSSPGGRGDVSWRCGGSLISKRYILTAAHCIRTPPTINVKLTTVRLGEHDLSSESEGASPVDYGIEETIVHEGYKSQTNDIALIKLDKDVQYNDKIQPICLPSLPTLRTSNFEKKYPFVVGWGETSLDGPSSNVLLQVQVPVVDNAICRTAYAKHRANIAENQLCAGEMKGGKDSCRGDSGGPLMLPQTGVYYQIGIISFGYRCAEPGYPGVYTRVTSYLDWIKTHTNGLS